MITTVLSEEWYKVMITAAHSGTKRLLQQYTVGQRDDYSSTQWYNVMITAVHSWTQR